MAGHYGWMADTDPDAFRALIGIRRNMTFDERFRQFLEAQKNGSANQLADGLLEEIARWSARGEAEDLDDDITIVSIHVTDIS